MMTNQATVVVVLEAEAEDMLVTLETPILLFELLKASPLTMLVGRTG